VGRSTGHRVERRSLETVYDAYSTRIFWSFNEVYDGNVLDATASLTLRAGFLRPPTRA
jgi:hypothetical protein